MNMNEKETFLTAWLIHINEGEKTTESERLALNSDLIRTLKSISFKRFFNQ